MMRETLERMYIDIHGGDDKVNTSFLAILSELEIIQVIVLAGRLGVDVSALHTKHAGEMLRVQAKAIINHNKENKS